jgi:hypothetical protein
MAMNIVGLLFLRSIFLVFLAEVGRRRLPHRFEKAQLRGRALQNFNRHSLCRAAVGTISAGWNSAAEANVQASDKASNLPMLEIPGLLENIRLPKAVAVINALKNTVRVRVDYKKFHSPVRHAIR